MIEKLLPGLSHLQNPHPLFVHYPIALLLAATVFYALAWARRSESLSVAAFWMLMAGAAAAAVAVATGQYAEEGVMVARSVRAELLDRHQTLMWTTASVSIVAAAWAIVQRPFPRRARPLFMLLLVSMLVVLFAGADYGGRMVYDYNAGGSACGQPIEFTK